MSYFVMRVEGSNIIESRKPWGFPEMVRCSSLIFSLIRAIQTMNKHEFCNADGSTFVEAESRHLNLHLI